MVRRDRAPIRRRLWPAALLAAMTLAFAPIWILWCPGTMSLRTHLYQNLMYGQLARRLTRDCRSTEEVVERLAEYASTHVWPAYDLGGYDGKPLDYLVKGVGWCDYLAKIHLRLLATRGIPARYAMLLEAKEASPHTIAEVRYGGTWGAYDVLFNLRFTDPDGRPLPFETLSLSRLEAQPLMALLRRQFPDRAAQIRELYARVLPVKLAPRRSRSGTQTLSVFDHALLLSSRWAGQPFVDWYQDRYWASRGLAHPSTADERLLLARHWHLAGRSAPAKEAYLACIREEPGTPVAFEARFWLGLLQLEIEGDAASALRTFEESQAQDQGSRWVPMTWYYMGQCEERLGHPDQARTWYVKAGAHGMMGRGSLQFTEAFAPSVDRSARQPHTERVPCRC